MMWSVPEKHIINVFDLNRITSLNKLIQNCYKMYKFLTLQNGLLILVFKQTLCVY